MKDTRLKRVLDLPAVVFITVGMTDAFFNILEQGGTILLLGTALLTFTYLGSNSIFCRELGLHCTVLLFEQSVTPNVKQNLRLVHAYGSEIVFNQTLLKTVLEYFITRRIGKPLSYSLPSGGPNVLGTIGFVNAAFELKDQVGRGLMSEPTDSSRNRDLPLNIKSILETNELVPFPAPLDTITHP